MKARTKKIVLAAFTALMSAIGDVSVQLIAFGQVNVGRTALVGLGMGVVVRVAGAVLANIETTDA